jgi:hypothetical protein
MRLWMKNPQPLFASQETKPTQSWKILIIFER